MKRFFKILAWSVLVLAIVLVGAASLFMYKVKNGWPVSYETEPPNIIFPEGKRAVLLFSKSTGYRHNESIEAAKKVFADMASKNDWLLYHTEEGGVFNAQQLAKFSAVIFNNSTGRLLNDEQQKALEDYVTAGGNLIGIHGAGDNSHADWAWYNKNFIGVEFSHHPLDPQLQAATINLNTVSDSALVQNLPQAWQHTDEWYIFFENPRSKGFQVLYSIDGDKIIPNGNILFVKDKNFGMGADHPVAWYHTVGKGQTFYTSIGHDAKAWQQTPFIQMLENAIQAKLTAQP
jgi:uncharacterized protein